MAASSSAINLPAEPDRAEELVALLAGNLVRDEAAELGAALKKKTEKPPAPAPAAKPPPDPAPGPVAPPRPCAREGVRTDPIGVDFLPFLGTSTFVGVGISRRFSLNILGGYTAGLEGSWRYRGLVNIESEFACGLQMAGLANLAVGPVRGAQLAGIVNLSGTLDGASSACSTWPAAPSPAPRLVC